MPIVGRAVGVGTGVCGLPIAAGPAAREQPVSAIARRPIPIARKSRSRAVARAGDARWGRAVGSVMSDEETRTESPALRRRSGSEAGPAQTASDRNGRWVDRGGLL